MLHKTILNAPIDLGNTQGDAGSLRAADAPAIEPTLKESESLVKFINQAENVEGRMGPSSTPAPASREATSTLVRGVLGQDAVQGASLAPILRIDAEGNAVATDADGTGGSAAVETRCCDCLYVRRAWPCT